MKQYIRTLLTIALIGIGSLRGQSNLLENGGFEAIWGVGHYPRLGENLFDRCPYPWMDYNPGDDERWYVDSIWAGNFNLPNPLFQLGYYKMFFDNISAPWEDGDTINPKIKQDAYEGNAFIGVNLLSDLFTREGIQQEMSQNCGLNSGYYNASLQWARPYPTQSNHFWLALSDQSSDRRRVISDLEVDNTMFTPGQWYSYSTAFNLDLNDPQDMGNRWFNISGATSISSGYGKYMFFDDVRLWRPCDDILACYPTHGQICPSISVLQAPGDLLRVSNIANASDLHLKISALSGTIIKDTVYHNANGLPDFRFTRLDLPLSTATAYYQYDLEITNACGGFKKTGNIQVYDTAAYNPIVPYRDTTANWTGVPIPCCLNTLTLQNTQIVGDVSFIVRNEIIVQSGVSLAPNSHVTLQAGNVTELSNVDFDGSNSSLEIIEVPCPNRMACGNGCGGGAMVIDAGQFVVPETLSSFEDSVENLAAIKSNSQSTMLEEPPMPQEISLGAFPNPFAKDLQIGFELPEEMVCSLQVTDIHLRTVKIALKESKMPAGSNQLVLDLGNLPSGIYFVKLEANGRMFHQRVVKQ
ncbi:MAG: hypothetical protein RLZZ519_3203 [Bacteroidota bacterium]|jgi:hypothetical protein